MFKPTVKPIEIIIYGFSLSCAYLFTKHVSGPYIRKNYFPSLQPGWCYFNPWETRPSYRAIVSYEAEREKMQNEFIETLEKRNIEFDDETKKWIAEMR